MKTRTKRLERMQEIARVATRQALEKCPPIPPSMRAQLVLGGSAGVEESGEWVFELYLPAERPQDAIILTRVRVSDATEQVVSVKVFPERWSSSH